MHAVFVLQLYGYVEVMEKIHYDLYLEESGLIAIKILVICNTPLNTSDKLISKS